MDEQRDEHADAQVIPLRPEPDEADEQDREALEEPDDDVPEVEDNVIRLDRSDPPDTIA